MSVLEKKQIDGMAYDGKNEALILLITDHLAWDNEYDHLICLQEKINNYVQYCETKQYIQIYKQEKIRVAVIDIRFLHELPNKALQFLQVVQDQVGSLGIKIKCTILEGANEQ